MPRYFFTIHSADHLIEDDQRGVVLPDDRAALSHAEHAINERQSEHDDPQLMMFVMDDQHVTLWSLPFVPACA